MSNSNTGMHWVEVTLNGESRAAYAEDRTLLSDFIRHDLGATGTHVGCEHGVCGACTVQLDGVAIRSCLCFARQADGRQLTTIEGLANEDDSLGVLQAAFKRNHALQCGFCTAGILMSAADYLSRVAQPTEDQIRDLLSGHLCRCTGYAPIVRAIKEASEEIGKKISEVI